MPQVLLNKDKCYSFGNEATTVNKTGEWRFLTPARLKKLSPCRQGCLLEGDIPAWMEAVKKKDWKTAWQIMKEYNPFPALTGYVCFHPCMENCNRGQLDQGIDIQSVEKEIGHWRLDNYSAGEQMKQNRGSVGIIGSGPAGLSCAYYLSSVGYEVTVYEKSDIVGGMLSLGIPEYRLPRNILKRELAILEDLGITFITCSELGKDITLNQLHEKHDALFIATGAWIARKADIPGEESAAVWNALDFLTAYNRNMLPEIEGPIVVVGGGNAAVDSARSALRLPGVHQVSLIYRRSRAEMPADQREVEFAEKEGVELIFNAAPREIITEADKIDRVIFDFSKTDRSGLVVDQEKSFEKSSGTVIMALGQNSDYSVLGRTILSKPFFAGGDMITGPATVPEAIKSGRVAAEAIRCSREGLPFTLPESLQGDVISFEDLNLAARINMNLLEQKGDPETEAARCLGCGTCNSCGICYLFCPDLAVDIIEGRYEFNLDYCKGCGICVKECPARALVLEGGC